MTIDNAPTGGTFDFLYKEDADPGQSQPNEDVDKGKEKVELTKEQYDELVKKVESAAKPAIDNDKLDAILEQNKKLKQLEQVFLPNEEETKAKAKRKAEDEYDADPIGVMERILDEKLKKLEDRQTQAEINAYAKDVMSEVDKEYIVDWKKDGQKIAKELSYMNQEYKQKYPKEATLKAMRLASVGKKREAGQYPYYEPANFRQQQREAAQKTEAESYFAGIKQAAKESVGGPLSDFFRK